MEEHTQSSVEDMDCCPAPVEEARRTRELTCLLVAVATATQFSLSRRLTVWVTALRFYDKIPQEKVLHLCSMCHSVFWTHIVLSAVDSSHDVGTGSHSRFADLDPKTPSV